MFTSLLVFRLTWAEHNWKQVQEFQQHDYLCGARHVVLLEALKYVTSFIHEGFPCLAAIRRNECLFTFEIMSNHSFHLEATTLSHREIIFFQKSQRLGLSCGQCDSSKFEVSFTCVVSQLFLRDSLYFNSHTRNRQGNLAQHSGYLSEAQVRRCPFTGPNEQTTPLLCCKFTVKCQSIS